jgi:hypothetical protein
MKLIKRETAEQTAVRRKKRRRWLVGGGGVTLALAVGIALFISSRPALVAAPEAERIMAAQQGLRFGILIPRYIPKGFDREAMALNVDTTSGPSGEPMADLTYRNLRRQAAIFIKQWVPGQPQLETLSKSKPIVTKWGTGWLMTQEMSGIATLWVDIGQLRVSVSSSNTNIVTAEQLLEIANTMGLASEDQVYTFQMEPASIKGVEPPPPFEVQLNADGIQELNLTITPGGYSPVRFAVKKGVPVKISFRALGDVGCGNVVVIDKGDGSSASMEVTSTRLLDSAEFTPKVAGEFQFNCAHYTFRGIMTVRE